jgi:hypothetical protein
MEAWKFTSPKLLSYPAAALNVTTERWRMQPFPENLVAVKGSWNSSKNSNSSSAWPHDGIVYPCGKSLCSRPRACQRLSCALVIEGIGATTTGPAHSNIVDLTHGIIVFLIVLITTALIATALVMGCCQSALFSPSPSRGRDDYGGGYVEGGADTTPRGLRRPRQSSLELDQSLNRYYTRPQRLPTQRSMEISWALAEPTNEAEKTRQITRCTALMRKMYALDLQVWSMEGVELRERDQAVQVQLQERAESIFQEVAEVVRKWKDEAGARAASGGRYWSEEEARIIDAIHRAIHDHLRAGDNI